MGLNESFKYKYYLEVFKKKKNLQDIDVCWTMLIDRFNPETSTGQAIFQAQQDAKEIKFKEIETSFSKAKTIEELNYAHMVAINGTSSGGDHDKINQLYNNKVNELNNLSGVRAVEQTNYEATKNRAHLLDSGGIYERRMAKKAGFFESSPIHMSIFKKDIQKPQINDYIIYHPYFQDLRNAAFDIKNYLKNNNYLYWETIQIDASRTFSKQNRWDISPRNKTPHLEIKLIVNAIDNTKILNLIDVLKSIYLTISKQWLSDNNSTIILQFTYDKEAAEKEAEYLIDKIKSEKYKIAQSTNQLNKTPKTCSECQAKMMFLEDRGNNEIWICENDHTRMFPKSANASTDQTAKLTHICPSDGTPLNEKTTLKGHKYFECPKCGNTFNTENGLLVNEGSIFNRLFGIHKISESLHKALRKKYNERDGNTYLNDAKYRKSVRDVCPRCNQPTLMAQYDNGNNGDNPNRYVCSSCGKIVTPHLTWLKSPVRFKSEKINRTTILSILPRSLILLLGLSLFVYELTNFGGGDFGGEFWLFAIIGTILGLISITLDFFEKRKDEAEKEGERTEIVNAITGGTTTHTPKGSKANKTPSKEDPSDEKTKKDSENTDDNPRGLRDSYAKDLQKPED